MVEKKNTPQGYGLCSTCLIDCSLTSNESHQIKLSSFRSTELSLYLTSWCCCRTDRQVFSSSSQNLLLEFWSLFLFILFFISFWQAELGRKKTEWRDKNNYYFVSYSSSKEKTLCTLILSLSDPWHSPSPWILQEILKTTWWSWWSWAYFKENHLCLHFITYCIFPSTQRKPEAQGSFKKVELNSWWE